VTNSCADWSADLSFPDCGPAPPTPEEYMTWKTPKIVEVSVGMEINMYACAVRK
jgi:coenzyme PQQ precursor peptide PqqA